MKKFIALALALCLACVLLVGCGSDNSQPANNASTPADNAQASSLSGKIATGGSTSMKNVIAALQEEFMAANPDVDVTYDPTGSGAGVTGAQEGSLDIGLASRGLKEAETGVTAVTVALDGIAIIVNNENPVADLTKEQIAAIATGEITDWAQVGGNAGEIVMIGREAGSGTRDGFESILKVSDSCVYAQELTATGAVIAAVQANPNAIGYASLSALDGSVKDLTVEGVACTEATVQDGSYAVQRPFNFVLKEGGQSDLVKAFVDFATSAEASELIVAAGAVPVA